MPYLEKGKLVEYNGDDEGSVTNEVVFQFNPESLTRTIQIPPRPTGSPSRETQQAGDLPYEKISLTIHFSAADSLNVADSQALSFGVSHQLAALEKMAQPPAESANPEGGSVDPTGDSVSQGSSSTPATLPTPRQQYPNALFTWGEKKALPVIIDSMTITEKQFDSRLNPIQAEVALGLSVITITPFTEDPVARGAVNYSNLAKDEQAASNRARSTRTPNTGIREIAEIFSF